MAVGVGPHYPRRLVLALVVCLSVLPAAQKTPRARRASSGEASRAREVSARISDVRFWSLTDTTRVAIETTGDFTYKYDRLSNPERIFFDISGVRPADGSKPLDKVPVDDGLLKQIRIAQSSGGSTRVVLDLEVPAEVYASQLPNPNRLIIEIRQQQAKKPEPAQTEPARDEKPATSQKPADSPAAPIARVAPARPEPPKPEPVALAPAETPAPRGPAETVAKTEPQPSPKTAEPAQKGGDPSPQTAKRTNAGERSMTRVLGLKLGKVVLDAGHGGHDGGTHGPTGLLEKDLVLDVTRRLGALIESRLGSEVIYTRDEDIYVPLEERTRIANRHKADLFLSIHANSSPVKSVSGIETYYLNFTSSKTALEVAARENASSERSIHDLKDLVQKIALKDKLDESRDFAEHVQTTLAGLSAKSNTNSRNRGVKKAPFVVLIGASMPSILVEIGFVTNPSDEAMMRKPEHRQKIAEALYKGIQQYASGLSHFEVAKSKSSE
ncbi:MAG: N-acetylmuramoyl-L-alanine amidase [Acidobacteria bacterium]|nr:N-acetylmuramoyl-L-alanine amidase [Acidobacteriota bacterium]